MGSLYIFTKGGAAIQQFHFITKEEAKKIAENAKNYGFCGNFIAKKEVVFSF